MILALKIAALWTACIVGIVVAINVAKHRYERTLASLPPVRTPEARHSLDYWESAIIPGQD